MPRPDAKARPLLAPIDPGYLFLIAGLALLAAAVLIPAQGDLADARWRRDTALAHEHTHRERLERYEHYLDALDGRDPAVIESLAVLQLNILPDRAAPVTLGPSPIDRSASIFRQLEPPPAVMPARDQHQSILAGLVTDRGARLWVIAFAAVCILYSVLPRNASPR
jgi:hypothetical protein